jgi:hypothetical protein
MFCSVPAFVSIPIIGGIRIKAKNIMTAERYRVYFKGFLEENRFNVFHSLLSTLQLLSPGEIFLLKKH